MHRTIKRVPLDFDWPLHEEWKGYVAEEPRPCPAGEACVNGHTPAGDYLQHIAHLLLIPASSPSHPWVMAVPFVDRPISEDIQELTEGLAGRSGARLLGHDALDRFAAAKAIVKAAGLDPATWGICPECHGHAYHPDDVEMVEGFERTEPPTGEGWQLWETVTVGSPISPVCETPEELARWCYHHADLFAGVTASYEQWLSLIEHGEVEQASMVTFRTPT